MIATNQRFVTPRDVARVLFRHWRKVALFFCATIALTLLVIAVYPRSYSSEAKLLIRVGRESVALDPTATTGETIMLQKSQVDEVNSALNLLDSRAVLELVVDRVGATRILDDAPAGSPADASTAAPAGVIRNALDSASGHLGSLLRTLRLSDPGSDREMAVRRLESGVVVWAPKESTIISVSYSAASPELARDVVNAIAKVFLEEHVRLSQSEGSLEFFAQQAEKLHNELTAAQAELRDRKNEFQLTSTGNRQSVLEQARGAMRQKIYDLAIEESEMMSRYTDNYPPLIEIRRQREVAERMLTKLPLASQAKSSSELEDVNAESKLNAELAALNDQEFQLAQLERTVELLEGKYRMHVEKLEQARVNDALGRERISNVKVAQPATFVEKPDSPRKQLMLALGLIIASVGGIGYAFLAELLDQTLRTTDQVESQLGMPVLLSFPLRNSQRRSPLEAEEHDASYSALVRELLSNGVHGMKNGHRHARTVGVVGCEASKLRSQVAADLAIEAASSGADPVLLIDADARRRSVTKRFHINGSPGWREVMAGVADAESCIHRPEASNLSVMSPGSPNGHEPAARPTMGVIGQLDEIKTEYGLVVVDLPPAGDMDSPPPAPEWLDEMVLVVEAEHTRIQAAKRAKDLLNRAGVHVAGVVLANRREHIPRWLYQRL